MRAISDKRRRQLVKAGKARAKQFTPAYQKWARKHVKRESLQRGGRNAFKKLAAAGKLYVVQVKMSQRNVANASQNHQVVRAWLQEKNIPYRECFFPFQDSMHEVDFVIPAGVNRIALEVDGFRFQAAPFGDTTRDRRAELKCKLKKLMAHGYRVFTLDARRMEQELARFEKFYEKFKTESDNLFSDELPF